MESHQVKEWSHLVFLSEYPSALLRSAARWTRKSPATVAQLTWHSSTGHFLYQAWSTD